MWKIIKPKKCPCCDSEITYDYFNREYLEKNSGDGFYYDFRCPYCNAYILSKKEYNKYSESLYAFFYVLCFIVLIVSGYERILTYYILGGVLAIWIIMDKYMPFILVNFQCIKKE